jgi:hypothetical protein
VQHPDQEQDLQGTDHAAEQVGGAGAGDDLAQDRVPEDEREACREFVPQLAPRRARPRPGRRPPAHRAAAGRFGGPDEQQ